MSSFVKGSVLRVMPILLKKWLKVLIRFCLRHTFACLKVYITKLLVVVAIQVMGRT